MLKCGALSVPIILFSLTFRNHCWGDWDPLSVHQLLRLSESQEPLHSRTRVSSYLEIQKKNPQQTKYFGLLWVAQITVWSSNSNLLLLSLYSAYVILKPEFAFPLSYYLIPFTGVVGMIIIVMCVVLVSNNNNTSYLPVFFKSPMVTLQKSHC